MNLNRVGTLLYRELVQGPKSFIFIFAIVVPVVLSLVLSLLFGTLFSGKPRLGISAASNTQFAQTALAAEGILVREFADEAALRAATERGSVDMGLALPADFDAQVASSTATTLVAYVWGESTLRDRALIVAATSSWVRDIAGQTAPFAITTTVLGAADALSWEQRLLPLVILLSVMIGGVMLPASSLVTEKQKRTLLALSVTPTTRADLYVAKGLVGVLISTAMALVILALNQSLGSNMLLLAGILFLGTIFAAEFGVLLGSLVKDINALFAAIKALGLLLYAPAIIAIFPDLPQWIAQFFPTYYVINPVIAVAQHGATLSDIGGQLAILVALIAALAVVIGMRTRREGQ